ncbi:MAG: hypothetical protein HQK97_13235 [Nitrospirae bacterium]|nr:hypothetical protein [Nitrospirota bacterium]
MSSCTKDKAEGKCHESKDNIKDMTGKHADSPKAEVKDKHATDKVKGS